MAKIKNGKTYLGEHLTANDYYSKDESVTGMWVGALASEWQLTDPINAGDQAFENLRLGKTPDGLEKLTQRSGGNVRFYDFQCSAQKSVSLMAVTLDDQRLRETHQRLSREALEGALQQFACRRVRAGAKAWTQDVEPTGKILAAAFFHTSSRSLDSQCHTHFVVANSTLGRDGKRYALETSEMLKAIRYAGKTYQNSMARAVRELGYQIVEKMDHKGAITGFEIAGIPEKILTRFSKRRADVQAAIGRFILETGRDPSPREIHTLTLQSRGKDRAKLQEISTPEVRALQLSQLSKEERSLLEKIRDAAKAAKAPLPPITPEECDQAVDWALTHLTERQSVITRHELEAEAINSALGYVDAQGISEAANRFLARGTLVSLTDNGLQSLLSTPEVLAMEKESIAAIDHGRWGCKPLSTFTPSDNLSQEQNEAIRTLTENRSRHAILRGLAGTGKTTTLKHFNQCLTASSKKPLYLAPTSSAVKVLKKVRRDDRQRLSGIPSRSRPEALQRCCSGRR
jgi:conjugative relaxase-like TrwC/TraI family protein